MNTCNTCKYWGNRWPINDNKANECGLIGLDESHSKDTAFIDVRVSDDSGLDARVMTIGTFGCTLHKAIIN